MKQVSLWLGVFALATSSFTVKAQSVDVNSIYNFALSSCKSEIELFEVEEGKYYNKNGRYIGSSEQRSRVLGELERKSVAERGDLVELGKHGRQMVRLSKERRVLASHFNVAEMCMWEAVAKYAESYLSTNSATPRATADTNSSRYSDQSSQSDVNQSIALAQQNQARAEEQKKKHGRRKNYPELDASSCLTPEVRPGFTGFKNSCPYPVRYTYCTVNPKSGTGAAFVDCSKQSGAGTVPANGEDFAHMKGAEGVTHVGCRPPGTAISRKFEDGRLWADCAKLGGD